MRTINGWVESLILHQILVKDFFYLEVKMKLHGFYILKDEYFELVDDCYLKNNKDGNRPFYYCFKDNNSEKEIYWMIPLSSKIEKYSKLIENKKVNNKPCDGLYICKLPNDKESVFLIQDIFPITEVYVERAYTLGGNPLILPYEKDVVEIEKKAKKVISLVKRGIKLTPTSPDINSIIKKIK